MSTTCLLPKLSWPLTVNGIHYHVYVLFWVDKMKNPMASTHVRFQGAFDGPGGLPDLLQLQMAAYVLFGSWIKDVEWMNPSASTTWRPASVEVLTSYICTLELVYAIILSGWMNESFPIITPSVPSCWAVLRCASEFRARSENSRRKGKGRVLLYSWSIVWKHYNIVILIVCAYQSFEVVQHPKHQDFIVK
jgi:hypothetical protein